MAFIPATPGIVGFGGGNKPAIFQAVAPQPMSQQTDDGPFTRCHDSLGNNLKVAISGIVACSGCYTINAGGGPQDVEFSFTGLNGMFTAVWNAITSAWEVVIGTATVSFFPSADGSCTGDPTTSTADVMLSLQCSGDNSFTAISLAGAAITVDVFENVAGTVQFGDPLPNTFVLGDCGTGTGPAFIGAYGGNITITLPP